MQQLLLNEKYHFVSNNDKAFIVAFDNAMQQLGYVNEGIKNYVCWGKYMIAYTKSGMKTKNYIARFYFRDDCIIFRLYFKNIDKHRQYIENAQPFIKLAFTNDVGKCQHCNNNCKDKNGKCSHRKTYTLDGNFYEKCDGLVFQFNNLDVSSIPNYIDLITTFYPVKTHSTTVR